MTDSTPSPYLSRLSEFIALHLGLRFPKKRWRDLERAMNHAAVKLGFEDAQACARWFLCSPPSRQRVEVLASCLTVGETYFFREMKGFMDHVLPDLISSRCKTDRRLRIWSAGCATGEEPYSIAMLLDRELPDLCAWDVSILATDINPLFLQKAKEGTYGEWSFRGTGTGIKEQYFVQTPECRFKVAENIRKMVTFEYFNLVEYPDTPVPSQIDAMDVIFCRNVLMYFDTAGAAKAARLFHRSLSDGGWLVVNPAEASHSLFSEYAAAQFPGAILFRKLQNNAAEPGRQRRAHGGLKAAGCGKQASRIKKENERVVTQPCAPSAVIAPGLDAKRPPSPCEGEAKMTRDLPDAGPDPHLEASDLLERGLYGEAAQKALALLRQSPNDARGMALVARAYANGGKTADALEWCQKTVAAERLNPAHYYLLATVLQEMEQIEACVKALRQALFLDPDFVLANVAFGVISKKDGKEELSRKYFQNALKVLGSYGPEDTVPESGGITARIMTEIIRSSAGEENGP